MESRGGWGHGGGDIGLMSDLIDLITTKLKGDPYEAKTSVGNSLNSHLMAFAVDKARLEQKVVDFKEFIS